MKFLDLHSHVLKETYKKDYDKTLMDFISIKDAYSLNIALDLKTSKEVISLSKKYPNHFKAAIGIHPTSDNKNYLSDLEEIKQLYKDNKEQVIAIGEPGLNFIGDYDKDLQIKSLIAHLELAYELGLPIILHIREAATEIIEILKDIKNRPIIILHSWTGSVDQTKKLLELDCYFSYSGIVTFKNAKHVFDSMMITPIEKIFYETDCPWLSPEPKRGKQNIPEYSLYVAEFIANKKNLSINEFNDIIKFNFEKVFKVKNWIK